MTVRLCAVSLRTLSQLEAAYLAGVVDGEGCVFGKIYGGQLRVWVTVTNTDRDLLTWLQAKVGGKVYPKAAKLGTKPCFRWVVGGHEDMEALLLAIQPYMIVKADRAQEILAQIREWKAA